MTAPTRLVTIGLPVFNGGPFVEEALRSILTQDHDQLEVLIADNASTDDTLERCREVAAGDHRVRVLTSSRNRGAAWNYNRLLEQATGHYFKWAAADDVCAPSFVSSCVEVLEDEGPGTVIAFPQSELIDETGAVLGSVDDSHLALRDAAPHRRLDPLLRNRFEWHPVFGVMPTALARSTMGIGAYVLADVVFLVEMALLGRFAQVPETLFLRRYHPERPLVAQPRFKDQAAWFDTDAGRGASFPQVNAATEILRAIGRGPLPVAEKARCTVTAMRAYILPHWRHMGGEAKLAVRERAGRS
jgi:glycosyltransferase involved in cell wall biosynthesis